MRINESDSQLYVGVMLAKLRDYQRAGGVPEFTAFCDEIMAACSENKGQSAPLEQRLMVLRQFVADSPENQELQSEQEDLQALVAGGTLVVADMTDPMLAPAEANGVFQVLLEQFRRLIQMALGSLDGLQLRVSLILREHCQQLLESVDGLEQPFNFSRHLVLIFDKVLDYLG